jgi:hypothetical protein
MLRADMDALPIQEATGRLGLIGAPSRICQALAPLAFGLLIEPLGRWVVAVSAGLSLAALVALMCLQRSSADETVAQKVT